MIHKNNNGFRFFHTRPLNDPIDVVAIENEVGIKLPPLYKVFLETFYIGSIRPSGQISEALQSEDFLFKDTGRYYSLHYIDNNLYPESPVFSTPDESIDYFKSVLEYEEVFFINGIADCFPIGAGNGVNSPGLFVGFKDYNLDKIYLENSGLTKGRWTFLANNIFEFIRAYKMREYTDEECKKYKFTYDRLYRNWGEDFWRVREEES